MRNLTFEQVSALLSLEEETGRLIWKAITPEMFTSCNGYAVASCNRWNARFAGKEAFTAIGSGRYKVGAIYNVLYQAHRVVWLLHTGQWPSADMDHINGDCLDNRVCNLRSVEHSENQKNLKRAHTNKSGVTGVCWDNRRNKWRAEIRVIGKKVHLISSDNFDDAVEARKAAEAIYGFHANHGRSDEIGWPIKEQTDAE